MTDIDQTQSPARRIHRVRRPLGLTLAILMTAVLYGVMPLCEVYFMQRLDVTASEAFLIGGIDINLWTWVQGLVGGAVLIVCALAWLGRPSWIRFVLVGLLLLLTGVNLYRIVETWTTSIDPIFGGQTQAAERFFLRCQFPAMIVAPLYVIWYINRAPARAFYRRVPPPALAQVATPANEAAALDSAEESSP
jgi:hypothetical protein